jgi:uncharacterized protein (TIGR02996 family)
VDLEDALLQAIRESPHDDTPRLALGDWLLDQDDPVQQARGELIHLQCRLTRMKGYEPAWPALRQRAAALLAEHRETWLDGLTAFLPADAFVFEHGLIHLNLRSYLSPEVSPADLAWLADWRWVEGITLDFDTPFEQALAAWVDSPELEWITSLSGHGSMGRLVIDVLARGRLPRLLDLSLMDSEIDDRDVQRLVKTPAMSRLTRLSLSGANLSTLGVAVLAGAANANRLRRLSLSTGEIYGGATWLGVLAGSPHLRELTELELSELPSASQEDFPLTARAPGDDAALALARSSSLRRLTRLSLTRIGVAPKGMTALTGSRSLARLRELDLSLNPIGDRGARLLASSSPLCRLEQLTLRDCGITGKGMAALARSSNVQWLRKLDLMSNSLKSSGVEALAASPHLGRLLSLDLTNNQIDDRGALALASSTGLAELRRLELVGNRIGDRGAGRLIASPHLPHLRDLWLLGNSISEARADEWRESQSDRVFL